MIYTPSTSAIILKIKPAFYEWITNPEIFDQLPVELQSMLKNNSIETLQKNGTVIAIPEITENFEVQFKKYIETHTNDILLSEMSRWGVPESHQSSTATVELLNEWFDISYHTKLLFIEDNEGN